MIRDGKKAIYTVLMIRRLAAASRDEGAQGLIEFAILSAFLSFLALGIIDFSRFMYYQTAVQDAARVGAEVAIYHCPSAGNCDQNTTPLTDDIVIQAVMCDANQNPYTGALSFDLNPGITSVTSSVCQTPCDDVTVNCTVSANQECGNNSGTDICVVRHTATSAGTSTDGCTSAYSTGASPAEHQCVEVDVGWDFKPLTPLISQFFHTQACWSGDNNSHNLCASAIGKVY
ncbi:MAG TPA: TadE family protein [Chloroflexota bacterium]|nr:TadE family protein [Chloroflexota bacterium]